MLRGLGSLHGLGHLLLLELKVVLAQLSGDDLLANLLSLLDGVVCREVSEGGVIESWDEF